MEEVSHQQRYRRFRAEYELAIVSNVEHWKGSVESEYFNVHAGHGMRCAEIDWDRAAHFLWYYAMSPYFEAELCNFAALCVVREKSAMECITALRRHAEGIWREKQAVWAAAFRTAGGNPEDPEVSCHWPSLEAFKQALLVGNYTDLEGTLWRADLEPSWPGAAMVRDFLPWLPEIEELPATTVTGDPFATARGEPDSEFAGPSRLSVDESHKWHVALYRRMIKSKTINEIRAAGAMKGISRSQFLDYTGGRIKGQVGKDKRLLIEAGLRHAAEQLGLDVTRTDSD